MSCFYNRRLPIPARIAAVRLNAEEKRIVNQIKVIALLVNDYDAAIEFYTKKVGFEVAEDKAFGDSRWVTLAFPGQPEPALAVELAVADADRALVGKQSGSFPLLGLNPNGCLGDYERLKERGVKFHGEPQSGPWGTGVLFEDLYGNKLFMSQEA